MVITVLFTVLIGCALIGWFAIKCVERRKKKRKQQRRKEGEDQGGEEGEAVGEEMRGRRPRRSTSEERDAHVEAKPPLSAITKEQPCKT